MKTPKVGLYDLFHLHLLHLLSHRPSWCSWNKPKLWHLRPLLAPIPEIHPPAPPLTAYLHDSLLLSDAPLSYSEMDSLRTFPISALPYLSHAGFPFPCSLYLLFYFIALISTWNFVRLLSSLFPLLHVLTEHILYKGHWVPWCRLHSGLIRLTESFLSWSLRCIRKDRNGNSKHTHSF